MRRPRGLAARAAEGMRSAPAPSAGPAEHIRRAIAARTQQPGVSDAQQPVCVAAQKQINISSESKRKRAAELGTVASVAYPKKQATRASDCKKALGRQKVWSARTWRLSRKQTSRKFQMVIKAHHAESNAQQGCTEWTVKVCPYNRGSYRLWIRGDQSAGISCDLMCG